MTRRRPITADAGTRAEQGVWLLVGLLLVLGLLLVGTAVLWAPGPTGEPATVEESEHWTLVEGVTSGEDGGIAVSYSTAAEGTRSFQVRDVDPALVGAGEDWAYLRRSTLPDPLVGSANNYTAGIATVGPWALVGDLAVASKRAGRAQVTVVAPAGMDVDPARKAGFLAEFCGPYEFKPGGADPVTLVIVPGALPGDGVSYGDRGYIAQHAFWDGDVSSVWVHEYVHAQQDFELAPGMKWFREASATYLSYRVMEEQYVEVTEADVRERVDAGRRYTGIALSNRSALQGSAAEYERGARLLYTVDAAIRADSDGERTLVDVFRTLTEREGEVSVDEFVRIVEGQTGSEHDWLRAAITDTGDLDEHLRRASGAVAD